MCYFSCIPVAFNILSLSLVFVIWITLRLSALLLRFILPGTPCFRDVVGCLPSHAQEAFGCRLFTSFLRSFLSFSFWEPCSGGAGAHTAVPEASEAVPISLQCFLYSVLWSDFHPSVLQLNCPFFCLSYPAMDSF